MKRRRAREIALTFLYQAEIKNELTEFNEDILEEFLQEQNIKDEDIINFARLLIRGTIQNLSSIDRKISSSSINWPLHRMPYIDRNILRIAVYELLFVDDVPELVSINEAIELAKKYSTSESPKFVNGVLHRIKEEYGKKKVSEDEKE